MPAELRVMMERYCQLGDLLPSHEDFDVTDPDACTDVEMVVVEMRKVKAQIDAFILAANPKRKAGRRR